VLCSNSVGIRNGETTGSDFQLFIFHQPYCPITVCCVTIYLLAGLPEHQPHYIAVNSAITNEGLETEFLRLTQNVSCAENSARFRPLGKV
jgi:hypothetical protein